MGDNFDILRSRATLLRERCVAAHNRLLQDVSRSAVGQLARSLDPGLKLGSDSPRLRLLSSYTFWGSRQLGGSRRGFDKRFRRMAKPAERDLYRDLKQTDFNAWQCIETSGDDDFAARWRPVGPESGERSVALVFDGDCEPAEPREGDIWAGWAIEWEEATVLAFGFRVPDEGADRLVETADRRGWHDEEAGEGSAFERIEYERDVLTQSLRPDYQQCGLGEYHFLPPEKRDVFPKEFRRHLIRKLRDVVADSDVPWHLRLARVPVEEIDEWLEAKLERARKNAATRATRFRDDPVDDELLPRIVADRECLRWLGLEPGGTTIRPTSPPIETHPLEYLDLDEEWMTDTGLGPRTLIGEARRVVQDCEPDRIEAFEEAVETHRRRFRWSAMVRHAVEELEGRPRRIFRPEYKGLRKAADGLFDPVITEMGLSQLLDGRGGTGARIGAALDNADLGEEPYRVGDLPVYESKLLEIRGIGPSSAQDVREALADAMLQWPPELRAGDREVDDETRSEIEEGLDELEELF